MSDEARGTSGYDIGGESWFRQYVRENGTTVGFGRMQQIIDEEWRRYNPKRGGLLTLCGKCDALINSVSGKAHP